MDVPATIIFENSKGETVEIAKQVVMHSSPLNNAFQIHKLYSSIGTRGHIHLTTAELQNLKLIKECIDYNSLELQDLQQRLSTYNKVTDIPHLIQIIDMSFYLDLGKKVPHSIAQMIGHEFQSSTKRCEAFKEGVLVRLQGKSETLNLVAQEIIKPTEAKKYWLERAKTAINIEDQLNNYLTPQRALILVDSYESQVKGTSISFIPGDEKVLPTALQDLVRPSLSQKLSFTWKRIPKAYKWTMAGLGVATLAAAGYGFYNWYSSK